MREKDQEEENVFSYDILYQIYHLPKKYQERESSFGNSVFYNICVFKTSCFISAHSRKQLKGRIISSRNIME